MPVVAHGVPCVLSKLHDRVARFFRMLHHATSFISSRCTASQVSPCTLLLSKGSLNIKAHSAAPTPAVPLLHSSIVSQFLLYSSPQRPCWFQTPQSRGFQVFGGSLTCWILVQVAKVGLSVLHRIDGGRLQRDVEVCGALVIMRIAGGCTALQALTMGLPAVDC